MREKKREGALIVSTSTELFSLEYVKHDIKKLANGKSQDIDGLQA